MNFYKKPILALIAVSALCVAWESVAEETRPRPALDGSKLITCGISTILFNGVVPPNGFMVEATQGLPAVMVNDNGPAVFWNATNDQGGFYITGGQIFVTPSGYKPMGPVSVLCPPGAGTAYIAARAW
jgi:hypothetical protein